MKTALSDIRLEVENLSLIQVNDITFDIVFSRRLEIPGPVQRSRQGVRGVQN